MEVKVLNTESPATARSGPQLCRGARGVRSPASVVVTPSLQSYTLKRIYGIVAPALLVFVAVVAHEDEDAGVGGGDLVPAEGHQGLPVPLAVDLGQLLGGHGVGQLGGRAARVPRHQVDGGRAGRPGRAAVVAHHV